jgi:hypothetical protein
MTVTRDVIYDLLPAYFAGDVSDDTRALIEEFFTTDPEFGRMAQRFQTLHDEHLKDEPAESPAEKEREAFDQVRTRVKMRHAAVVWGMGALIACGIAIPAMVVGGFQYPGLVTGAVFAVMAGITWLSSRSTGAWAAAPGTEGRRAGSGRRRTNRAREHV